MKLWVTTCCVLAIGGLLMFGASRCEARDRARLDEISGDYRLPMELRLESMLCYSFDVYTDDSAGLSSEPWLSFKPERDFDWYTDTLEDPITVDGKQLSHVGVAVILLPGDSMDRPVLLKRSTAIHEDVPIVVRKEVWRATGAPAGSLLMYILSLPMLFVGLMLFVASVIGSIMARQDRLSA